MSDFLGSNDDTLGGENSIGIVHPAVMGPLLVWALRTDLDLSPDILAAAREHRRLLVAIPDRARSAALRPRWSTCVACSQTRRFARKRFGIPASSVTNTRRRHAVSVRPDDRRRDCTKGAPRTREGRHDVATGSTPWGSGASPRVFLAGHAVVRCHRTTGRPINRQGRESGLHAATGHPRDTELAHCLDSSRTCRSVGHAHCFSGADARA